MSDVVRQLDEKTKGFRGALEAAFKDVWNTPAEAEGGPSSRDVEPGDQTGEAGRQEE